MNLSIGIIGLPNVGKSTLFNILTEMEVNAANYPFATVDPNVGVVEVPDGRLDKLHALYKEKKKVLPAIEFFDIAGLVKGANKGEGLGNRFLAQIRETDVLVHVVRTFPGTDIAHVEGDIHPVRDIDTILEELRQKDLSTLEKRMDKEKSNRELVDKLKKLKVRLENGELLVESDPAEEFHLLTSKPHIFLLNGDSSHIDEGLLEKIEGLGMDHLAMNLAESPNMSRLTRQAYDTLNVLTFFTIGDDEVRGWTVQRGATAPEAAGRVHSDFQDQFIKAEVAPWQEVVEAGGWSKARSAGNVRTKGKDYVVKDGDVLLFKI